jgi:hypothetical protein
LVNVPCNCTKLNQNGHYCEDENFELQPSPTNINQLQIHTHSKKIEEHESIDILCSIDSSETKGACGNLLTDLEAFSSPFCISS